MKNPIRACYNNEDYYIKRLSIAADVRLTMSERPTIIARALWLVDTEPLHTAVLLLQLAENLAEDVTSLLRNKWRIARLAARKHLTVASRSYFGNWHSKQKGISSRHSQTFWSISSLIMWAQTKQLLLLWNLDVTAGDDFCVVMNREVTTFAWGLTRKPLMYVFLSSKKLDWNTL